MSLLELENISLSLGGRDVLRNVSLRLKSGAALGLVGASGSGKSLLALSIIRLLPAASRLSGQIRVDGVNLGQKTSAALDEVRGKQIGIVFQEPMTALNPVMSISAQVAEVFTRHLRVSRAEARRRAALVLDRVELPASLVAQERYPHELSGGQRQRVAIAIAIALQPKLLIADEPTTALDAITQAQILRLLRELAAETGAGLLFISHDFAAVEQVTSQLAVMAAGEIVEEGNIDLLRIGARQPATAALVAAQAKNSIIKAWPRPARNAPPRLVAERISHSYAGKPAIHDISFDIGWHESVGLIGASGSGKTTILRCLLGLIRPSEGEILIDGAGFFAADTAAKRALRRKIQIVFQDPYSSFDPRWRVEALVSEPLALADTKLTRASRRARVEALLELVGLRPEDASRFIHEFSGGQRQRLAIARALIVEPEIIVFDEATSALDVLVKDQILDLLTNIAATQKISYLFVTHDLAVARRMTHRVIVLDQGKIVESGPTETVMGTPAHDYTRRLLAAAG